jgi:hypothetical protein
MSIEVMGLLGVLGVMGFAAWLGNQCNSSAVGIGVFVGGLMLLGGESVPKEKQKGISLAAMLLMLMLIGCVWVSGNDND